MRAPSLRCPSKVRAALHTLRARGMHLGPLALASASSTANSLVVMIAYARLGSAESLGVYQIVIGIGAMSAIFAFAGSGTAATRAAAQGRQVAWPLFRARLPRCLATAGAMAVAAGVAVALGDARLGAALLAMGAAFPLVIGGDVFPGQLLGARRYRAFLRYQASLQLSMAVTVTAAVVVAPDAPWLAILAWGGTIGGWQTVNLVRVRGQASIDPGDLDYARSLSKVYVLSVIEARADIVLAGAFLGPASAGILAVARMLPVHLKYLWEIVSQPIFTRLATESALEGLALARRHRWQLVALIGVPAGATAAAAPYVIPPLFGEEFRPAILPGQLMLVGSVLLAFGSLEAVLLRAQGFIRSLTVVHVALPVLTFATLPPLVLVAGTVGVGIKAIVVSGVYAVLALFLAPRAVAAASRVPSPDLGPGHGCRE